MSSSRRKAYISPALTIINVDNEISLIMMSSDPPGDPGGFDSPTGITGESITNTNVIFKDSSNPFGGGSPFPEYN